jgi:salicylate hydroxylase
LPFQKGHAVAVEDSACLAQCLARTKNASKILKAFQGFETIRKPRIKLLAAFTERNAHIWQLPDGEEQHKRGETIRKNLVVQPQTGMGNTRMKSWVAS